MGLVKKFSIRCDFCTNCTAPSPTVEQAISHAQNPLSWKYEYRYVTAGEDPTRGGYDDIRWACTSHACQEKLVQWAKGQS
jgi:hypothetical protein